MNTHLENVQDFWGSRRSSRSFQGASSRRWGIGPDNVFGRNSARSRRNEADDEEALKWAALEKLPTMDRLHTTILQKHVGSRIVHEEVDVRRMGIVERQQIIDNLLKIAEEDNERFLNKLRARIDRVGIKLPTIEVRYEKLSVDATCFVGERALPTLKNATLNFLEGALDSARLVKSKKTTLNILNGISGIIKPARMTLLLGPPGSGKTTLLLALAGKLDTDLKVKGKITFNGHHLDEFVPQKTAVYISQNDLHVGEMTVRETLDFSARCQGVGTRYDMIVELARREKEAGIYPDKDVDMYMKASALEGQEHSLITDYIMKILGLDICANTMVGDNMHRGISGGQKKRVTTGEMIVGPTDTLFMDEISTGLDSSTTYQIVKCLRQVCHVMESTICMSLLQPAPETFELFDDVVLLSEGQIVYHGPREDILEFFEGCGFRCPERKGIADFLQEVTSIKDQEQYWFDQRRPYRFVSVKQFSDLFKTFHVGQKMHHELAVPYDKASSHKAALAFEKYSVGRYELFKTNFAKEWLLMKRNAFIYVFKTIQVGIVGLISMSMFFRTTLKQNTQEDGLQYMGAIFFGIVIIMFNGYAELSLTLARLPVFYKQRDLLFYPAWAYALPSLALSLPSSFAEAGIYTILTYYEIGFAPEASRFFKYYLILLLMHQMSGAMFRMIAGIFRTMVLASTGGTFLLLIIFMLGGFILPRPIIKPWWIWGYWVSPLNYAQSALSINEFLAPRWNQVVNGTGSSLGQQILLNRGMFPYNYYYWVGVGALLFAAVLFNVLYIITLTYLSPLGKPQASISEEALAEKRANLLGSSISDGSALLGGDKSTSRRKKTSSTVIKRNSFSMERGWIRTEVELNDVDTRAIDGNAPYLTTARSTAGIVKKGMILPFQPLAISFDDIEYFVDMPAEMKSQGITESRLQLLHGITGAFRPGHLTALVGVSGAGKTTLMDVLAGRKTGGYIEGEIKISGYPKRQETFARIAGYCEQNDIHSPQVTVRESLFYSAWLRLPADISKATREQFVDEVMELVELKPLENALVGLPGVSGLSTEQRKRLTIAVELVANPSIIFMDEPTSGLDARAAAIVMRTVRNTVDTGRTVVCTIHQPSIDIFEAFDEMLLLKRGGRTIYMGPLGQRSCELVKYFEAIPGVQKIKEGINPATWMLEASSMAVESQLGIDFADIYGQSSLCQRNKALVKELDVPKPGSSDLYFPTQYSQSFFTQVRACFWKQWWTYWRSPPYNCARFMFTVISAFLFGTIFWNMGKQTSNAANLLSVMGSIYGATLFLGINNASSVQPVVAIERTIFYRERAAGMYSAVPYAVAQVLIEIPYVFVQTIAYALITYSMINFEWTAAKFFWYFYVMFFTLLYFTYYGMMAVSLTPNHEVAAIVASGFYSVFNLFSGFVIFKPDIPKWWSWYYWACPTAWTLYGQILTQFGDISTGVLPIGAVDIPGNYIPVNEFLRTRFGFERDMLGLVVSMPIVFAVLFAGVFAFAIRQLNFQQR
ncbi:hypothetical protein M758_5G154100 [Ceratodon purpureus]|uniref:ABC transporter domain-containing protein n=1 Tax=Ceratodon purpureus TaxID=3225 RepID=A0A8T0I3Z7_CERPU|nr:hypothetical protein KC19_5G161100 [Ceratodon purpureus]KAG0577502.1 hypothetical protein KC19_5G161100 [Ceratodon purpureus]KAG0616946.1 hypothetical protein M758_5G154100 [Ceratodon purpureus]KAG0616947.1 hypothetical protein M758_5G154100 [Ceratodon purpureus]